ncbi:hypothetical protein EP331_13580 [bacterium]|nr:MAG: hypothetical protein EP331_13580 [bacterium]
MIKSFTQHLKFAKYDIPAGLVVFLVAIPLCLGIALASGAPLFSGIITGVIGGIVVGLLSGSHLSVSGPAAGLTVIVLNAIATLGSFEAFLVAVVLAGVLQIAAGYINAGIIGHYFPSSVIKGMLAAIGIILILKQLPHFVGLHSEAFGAMEFNEADGTNTFSKFLYALTHINELALAVGVISLGLIILWETKFIKKNAVLSKIPGALVAVIVSIVIPIGARAINPAWLIGAEQFVSLPDLFNPENLKTAFASPDWSAVLNLDVYVVAVTIAIIASLETLLSIEAVDKLDPEKRRTPNNQELKAQGVGNVIAGLLGGLPMTAVIVRSSANLNSGAKSKMAAVYHGLFLLVAVALIPNILNLIPLSALAAILLHIGYKLAKPALIKDQWRQGRSQFIPFIVTILAILFTDLLIGIIIGLNVGAYFILMSNYKLPFSKIETAHPMSGTKMIQIKLSEHVSFLNKASLAHVLEDIEQGADLMIDGTNSIAVDHDIVELISDFKTQAELKEINLTLKNIPELYSLDKKVSSSPKKYFHEHDTINEALKHNRAWIAEKLHHDPMYFNRLADGQTPDLLWIGCSDSRVVPNLITGLDAGDIFVHRNIANQLRNNDFNAHSALDYAVNFLNVSNIVVCGHYNCGGVKAALGGPVNDTIDTWIEDLRELAKRHETELLQIQDETARVNRLVELNVIEQLSHVMSIPFVQEAVKQNKLAVHGWVFDLKTGSLLDVSKEKPRVFEPVYIANGTQN